MIEREVRMFEIFNNKVSFFETIHCKDNSPYSVKQILDLIKNEKFKSEISLIQNETEKIKRDELKKRLPAVTISGLFNESRRKENIINHSGLIQIDLDNLENISLIKNSLIKDDYSFAVFESPSGKGLKVLVKIPPEINLHEKHFLELEKYYLIVFQLIIDKSCKDISRLMFLCSDKNIFINKNSKEYHLNTLENDEILFAGAIQKINNKNKFIDGKRNNYVFKLSCECKRVGLKEKNCIVYCLNYYSQLDFPENEIINTIKSGYSYNTSPTIPVIPGNTENEKQSLLQIRTGRQVLEDANSKPIPKMLFSEFWHEGEICILFADTNVGKSILAVQIANSISRGEAINHFKLEAKKQSVFYLDFELSDKQFQKRYSLNYESNYSFDDNFKRIDINTNFTDYDDFEIKLFSELEKAIKESNCKILIVDNITFLKTQSTETAKDALPLMRKLIELKKQYDLSMLILAHTPKRILATPISINDLAGSKHLSNFADSVFSIGTSSQDSTKRYLKQIKARATEKIFDGDNIIICKIDKPINFLEFQYLDLGNEREHLKQLSDLEELELERKIIDLKTKNSKLSFRKIAATVGSNHSKVERIIKRLM